MESLYKLAADISVRATEERKAQINDVIEYAATHILSEVGRIVMNSASLGNKEAYIWVSNKDYLVLGVRVWDYLEMSETISDYIAEENIQSLEERLVEATNPFHLTIVDMDEIFGLKVSWD